MTVTFGFSLERAVEIPELRTRASLFRHVQTGARLLSLSNDDDNKVFGITFRTPPPDSTGVAHILEHTVLCGSRKFPVKEPFVELLKGSLKTFLNAFTYPDRTCYPIASQNLRDFYNLADVYLDAVLFPSLRRESFSQEGWHLALRTQDAPLVYKGVVYNEMKGAYSSPENLLSEYGLQALFPDTPYGFDSGGDPTQIPGLSYEVFVAFHRRYYHPSNSWIYFYGDDDPSERLRFVDGYLRTFAPLEVDSRIALQSAFPSPRFTRRVYAAGEAQGSPQKAMTTLNWLLPSTQDIPTNFALRVLEHILLGTPGSPLRKALLDSGLGEDLAGDGLGTETQQMVFSCGLKGVLEKDAPEVDRIILQTLERLVHDGIPPLAVEAARNTLEFRLRENNTGIFPKGLHLMLRALSTWIYDGDPLGLVAFQGPLERLKVRIKEEPRLFEGLLTSLFLENPHRVSLVLAPDTSLARERETRIAEGLSALKASLGPEGIAQIIADNSALEHFQQTPDLPGALASIPRLHLEDLRQEIRTIPREVSCSHGCRLLAHPLFANGVLYLDAGFDLHALPDSLLPYAPLFGRALLELGTDQEDTVALGLRMGAKTGGVYTHCSTGTSEGGTDLGWLFLRGKGTLAQFKDLVGLLGDVLLRTRWDQRERFRQMALEERAQLEQSVLLSGHHHVGLRLRAQLSNAYAAEERMHGISYLFFLRRLLERIEGDWPGVLSELQEIQRRLLTRRAAVFSLTAEDGHLAQGRPLLDALISSLPDTAFAPEPFSAARLPSSEGLLIPAQVNFVGMALGLYGLGYDYHGSGRVIARYLRNAWLWERVRVQGGAYGAFCTLDRPTGILCFLSYRDPSVRGTLAAFRESGGFLLERPPSSEEIAHTIIGTVAEMDVPLLPDARGFLSLMRFLRGEEDAERQRRRTEVLGTGPERFRDFGRFLEAGWGRALTVVLGPEAHVRQGLDASGPNPPLTQIL